MIPVARPGASYGEHRAEIDKAVSEVLDGGDYVLGQKVAGFEAAFASYCGVAHGIGVNSGTDALTIALLALGIERGDRVPTVSHTALATVAAIISAGATPVLVDIDPRTYTCDPEQLSAAMSPSVKAIVPVHLYGHVAAIDAITDVARQWEVPVVEDCAQATGAEIGTKKVGSFGAAGSFSFYPTKNLGCFGDGGMIVTDDDTVADAAIQLRQYGWDEARVADRPGLNSRLDELQAAVLLVKLQALDKANARRRDIAERYTRAFAHLSIATPPLAGDATEVFHLYVISTPARDELAAHVRERGVGTAIHYPVPAHLHPGYASLVEVPSGGLPVTERAAAEVLSLPLYPELSDTEVDEVIEAVIASCDELGLTR